MRRMISAGAEGIERLYGSSSPEDAVRVYSETLENMERAKRGEVSEPKKTEGIKLPENLAIKVLMESLVHRFGDQARTQFPTFYTFFEMQGEDLDNATVRKLRGEFEQINGLINGDLELGIVQGSRFVYVKAFEGKGTLSPHAPFMARQLIRPDVDYDAKSRLNMHIQDSLAMCDEAIRRNCGFGTYSREA